MSIAKILVPVTGSPRDASALRTAFAFAQPVQAHVAALFVNPDVRETVPYVGVPLSPEVMQSIVDAAEEMARAASKNARGTLATAADERSVRIVGAPERSNGVTASYSERTGRFPTIVGQMSLLADIVVFPFVGHGDNPDVHEGLLHVLTKSERPVVLSPETAPASVGRRIAVGWDGGAAAAHAMTAALPYLTRAQTVQLLSCRPCLNEATSIEAAKAYLALHGIEVSHITVNPASCSISDLLFSKAREFGCDLLVVGGYGHSRTLETMFGGVTQRIVSEPQLPVFMMH